MNVPNEVQTIIYNMATYWIERHKDEPEADMERYRQQYHTVIDWMQQPAAPVPNWDDAPEWAQWWAVDESGQQTWFQYLPIADTYEDMCGEWLPVSGGEMESVRGIVPDWKNTLARRPEADE